MLTLLVFIIILGFLVFVHEIGHFLVARRNGIKADEFGLGFPPRAIGIVKDEKTGKWNIVKGNKEIHSKNTIYSLNWLPIGGFVKIKGENGEGKNEADSFASKSAWKRIKVLAAGVIMNFIFAWILFSFGFMLGVPKESDDPNAKGSQILIQAVEENSVAQKIGIKGGDVIENKQIAADGTEVELKTVSDVQKYISSFKDREMQIKILRGKNEMVFDGMPAETSDGEAKLGIGLVQVVIEKENIIEAFKNGAVEMKNVFLILGFVLGKLFTGEKTGIDVTGVVGIAVFTGQIIPLGFAYILRFAAILSVNLGIINALPFPALDGGRVLFILIEKIKGSPVSQKIEQVFHTVGFFLLILLMIFVTYKDLIKYDVFEKIKGIF